MRPATAAACHTGAGSAGLLEASPPSPSCAATRTETRRPALAGLPSAPEGSLWCLAVSAERKARECPFFGCLMPSAGSGRRCFCLWFQGNGFSKRPQRCRLLTACTLWRPRAPQGGAPERVRQKPALEPGDEESPMYSFLLPAADMQPSYACLSECNRACFFRTLLSEAGVQRTWSKHVALE